MFPLHSLLWDWNLFFSFGKLKLGEEETLWEESKGVQLHWKLYWPFTYTLLWLWICLRFSCIFLLFAYTSISCCIGNTFQLMLVLFLKSPSFSVYCFENHSHSYRFLWIHIFLLASVACILRKEMKNRYI